MPVVGDYSEVAICNLALQGIGRGGRITALDEASEAARVCLLRFPYARDAVLRAFPWNFAQGRAELAANATAPAFEFANAFDLPADCVALQEVYGGNAENWKVEGRQILTDMGAPIYIKYTKRVTDLSQADPLFVEALAARIASDICLPLAESASRAEGLWRIYKEKLIEARKIDSQESQPDGLPQDSWLSARNAGGTRAYRDWDGS